MPVTSALRHANIEPPRIRPYATRIEPWGWRWVRKSAALVTTRTVVVPSLDLCQFAAELSRMNRALKRLLRKINEIARTDCLASGPVRSHHYRRGGLGGLWIDC